jgi:predicted transcriptional regulator of viral defense system
MSYHEFRNALHQFAVFSLRDIAKLFPAFDTRRLVEWQQKGYLQKLVNKWYLFSDIQMDDGLRFRISNCLYRPSYVSVESALSHYNLIPEAVFTLQNVSTRKTTHYETSAGNFHYRTVKTQLFFGYRVDRSKGLPILFAEPEKAILDFLYLNPHIKVMEDIEGLRLNITELDNRVYWAKMENYAARFDSATLNKRVAMLKKFKMHVGII